MPLNRVTPSKSGIFDYIISKRTLNLDWIVVQYLHITVSVETGKSCNTLLCRATLFRALICTRNFAERNLASKTSNKKVKHPAIRNKLSIIHFFRLRLGKNYVNESVRTA